MRVERRKSGLASGAAASENQRKGDKRTLRAKTVVPVLLLLHHQMGTGSAAPYRYGIYCGFFRILADCVHCIY